jgi:protein-S-isoprenylcysteine O-methyltransferase Ste14
VSQLVFRYRYALHFVVYILGFTAPWNLGLHLDPRGPNAHVWGILAANLSQVDGATLFASFNVLLALAIFFAAAGAWLRTWGAAYIGSAIVGSSSMHTATHPADDDGILKDGPFAHLRNPLYAGTFLHTLALALLMPRSGAIFSIAAIGLLQLWLIHGEEAFLEATLGTPYVAYCKLVPRLWPALKARVAGAGRRPRWVQAILGETYFWGVALSFAVAGWRYNAMLLLKCVIVSVGLSLVARAVVGKRG